MALLENNPFTTTSPHTLRKLFQILCKQLKDISVQIVFLQAASCFVSNLASLQCGEHIFGGVPSTDRQADAVETKSTAAICLLIPSRRHASMPTGSRLRATRREASDRPSAGQSRAVPCLSLPLHQRPVDPYAIRHKLPLDATPTLHVADGSIKAVFAILPGLVHVFGMYPDGHVRWRYWSFSP